MGYKIAQIMTMKVTVELQSSLKHTLIEVKHMVLLILLNFIKYLMNAGD